MDQTDADFRNKNQAMETSGVANRLDIFLLYSLTGYCLSLPDHLEMDPQPTPPSPPTGGCGHVARRENILVNLGKLESLN